MNHKPSQACTMSWQKKIKRLMQERGWNQYDLADASGYRQAHISRLLSSDDLPSDKALKRLADAFEISTEYFTSEIPRPIQQGSRIPLLDNNQVPRWLKTPGLLKENHHHWITASVSCSQLSYALKVTSNDMSTPGGLVQYPINAIIMIDPEAPRKTGSRIICQLPDQRIVFRELQESANEFYLAPLNPAYPLIPLGAEFNARYLGKVIATLIVE